MRLINRLPTRVSSAVRASALCAAILGTALVGKTATADNWPQWRGPHMDGSTAATGLPDVLDAPQWSTAMPASSAGTPVVWGDRVFLSTIDRTTKDLLAVCLNAVDGKVLWQQKVAVGVVSNRMNDLASPSPITDGKTVWFYYGTGDLAAFDLAGKQLWTRSITKDFGPFNMLWLYAASPLLSGGKLYVPVLHRDVSPTGPAGNKHADSFLLCVDPQTGKDIYRVIRPTDAVAESREAYTTPIPMEVDGKTQIILVGGDCVTGHAADDGHEIWRSPSWNPTKIGHWRTVPSATTGAGLVFACTPKKGKFFAIKPAASGPVEVPLAWTSDQVTTDVCVALFYKDLLYVLDGDRKGILNCLDPATGTKKWSVELGSKKVFRASPTGADGKIYCMNEAGDVWVLSATDGKVLSTKSLGSEGGTSRSSIVVAGDMVIIRTADHLYAFAGKGRQASAAQP